MCGCGLTWGYKRRSSEQQLVDGDEEMETVAKIVACSCLFLRSMAAIQTPIWKLSRTYHEQNDFAPILHTTCLEHYVL